MTPEARIELLAYRFKSYMEGRPPWPPNWDALDEIIRLARYIGDTNPGAVLAEEEIL